MTMHKITIICLGKFKEKAYLSLESEYLKRLTPYAQVKVVELLEVPYGKNADLDRVKQEEAEKITKSIPKNALVILLDERGTERDSRDFSKFLERVGTLGQELVFVIGGGLGLHSSVKSVSNYQISLSKLTFPHNLARIFLEEQLFRAYTLLFGREYHKD